MTATPIEQASAGDPFQARALVTEVVKGHQSLGAITVGLADLAERCGAPTTAQVTWLLATTGSMHDDKSWAVLARNAASDLVGAVVLLDRNDGLHDTVTLAGTEDGQRGAILAECVTVAESLGYAVSDALGRRRRRPDVELGPLPADNPVVKAFVGGLHGSACIDVDGVPVIRRADAGDVNDYLSPGMRRTVRKATNRLNSDRQTGTIRFTTEVGRIIDLLPQLEQCHRDRDHAHGRLSDLDDSQQRWLWQSRIHALARADNLELATLHISDTLAAYVLGVIDGPAYRLLEGRFDTQWARYSPGRLLEAAVVQRMLDDSTLTTLDWMTSVASETLLATNDRDPMVVVCLAADRESLTDGSQSRGGHDRFIRAL